MIDEYCKERIIDAADVVDVLSDFIPDLKKKGSLYWACCPFHSERTPSFAVNPVRNRYRCYSCGRGGDAVQFLMEHEGMSFTEALQYIARKYNIEVKYVRDRERTQEDIDRARKKESALIALDTVQRFFVAQLNADNPEAAKAREYAYGRWGKEYCNEVGIGYAPVSSQPLLDEIKRSCLSLELLKELGVVASGDKGDYAFMRERVTIPIRGDWNKIIAWTGRYIGSRDDVGKYMNPTNSFVFNKSECWFGLDVAKRHARNTGQFIVVEGAPDVMRLQIVGLNEAIAPLGTALTEKHLDKLHRICRTLRFIPDSDPPKGALWGAGVTAVMKNGAIAIRKGFDVYVREIPRTKADDENGVKNDPDSFIVSREAYSALKDKHFLVWLGEKRFSKAAGADANVETLREIAALLIHVEDEMIREMCVESLTKMFGKKKQWNDAMKNAARHLRDITDEEDSNRNFTERERALLRKFGIIIKNNMYYAPGKSEGLERWSNFIIIPHFHVKGSKARRKFDILNEYGQRETLELEQKVFSSVQSFSVECEGKGNFVWLAKQDKLNTLKEYLYAITPTLNGISVLGWQTSGDFYAFADGLHDGQKFFPVDHTGMVMFGTERFYLPAFSDEYADDPEAFDYEKQRQYLAGNPDSLYQYVERLVNVFGDGAKIGFAWVLACIFRDFIYKWKDWFPVLNLFGIPGTGKTALAVALNSFFYVLKQDPVKLSNLTVPALNYLLTHMSNSMVVLDEYTNLLNDRIVDALKGLWGGTTNTKMNMNDDNGGISQGKVYCGVAICGQHLPAKDPAMLMRCIHLTYWRTSFSEEENVAFTDLKEHAKMGNAHHAMKIMGLRKVFIENFKETYALTRKEVKQRLTGEAVDDRILDNWVCILTSFRVLETHISVPYTYKDLFEVCVKGLRAQSAEFKKSSETADLWKLLNALHQTGKILDGTHYKIKAEKSFRSEKSEDTVTFGAPRKLLFLNWTVVQEVLRQRSGLNQMKMDASSLDDYLKNLPYFLGIKQRWFTNLNALGQPIVEYNGTESKHKSSRARAFVFDYEQLQAATDIDLESRVASDGDDEEAETEPQADPSAATPTPTLFDNNTEELPF